MGRWSGETIPKYTRSSCRGVVRLHGYTVPVRHHIAAHYVIDINALLELLRSSKGARFLTSVVCIDLFSYLVVPGCGPANASCVRRRDRGAAFAVGQ